MDPKVLDSRAALAPPLSELVKLQVMRTMLVKFLGARNFEEIVVGTFVRVLLEMRDDHRGGDVPDAYYIAPIVGARTGPPYSGFSWDGQSTEWHIVIDLPTCFRSAPNANVVQLNCISNTAFKQAEYDFWVRSCVQGRKPFISVPQIALRVGILEENKHNAACMDTLRRRDANAVADEKVEARKVRILSEIKSRHLLLPHIDSLPRLKVKDLQQAEQQVLECLSNVRLAINEKMKCQICHTAICTVICYPCKHQAMCRECSKLVDHCPAPGCGQLLQDKFEAFGAEVPEESN